MGVSKQIQVEFSDWTRNYLEMYVEFMEDIVTKSTVPSEIRKQVIVDHFESVMLKGVRIKGD